MTIQDIMDACNAGLAKLDGIKFANARDFHSQVYDALAGAIAATGIPLGHSYDTPGFHISVSTWYVETSDPHGRIFSLFEYGKGDSKLDKRFKGSLVGTFKAVRVDIANRVSPYALTTADYVTPDMTLDQARAAMDKAHAQKAIVDWEARIAEAQALIDRAEAAIIELKGRL